MTYRLDRLRARDSVLALVFVAAGAATALADTVPLDDPHRVQAVIDALKAGDVSAALAKLGEGPKIDALIARPELVYVLCDRAFRFDGTKPEPRSRRLLAERLFGLALAASGAAPQDDRLRWALAEALVLRERAGPRNGPDSWTQAADLLEKVAANHPTDALPLSYAVSFILEGACAEADSVVPFTNRAETLVKKATDVQKDSPTLAVTLASSQFWAARTLWATNHKMSRVELKAALDTLRPFCVRKVPFLDTSTVFNDCVVFGIQREFGLPDKFVMSPRTTLDGVLTFDLPVSSRWSFQQVAATADIAGYDYVTEMAPDGTRHRQVLFRRYAWNQKYTFEGPNAVGGDNVRSIAQGLQAQTAAHVFAAGATQTAPARRPFCKALDGYQFDVAGTAAADSGVKGEPVHMYGFVVRGKSQACYAILVYAYGKDDEEGLEMEALISSLREAEK